MKFKKLDDPIYSGDYYYDIFDGGYIKPSKMLANEKDINKVEDAIETLTEFLSEAESAGLLKPL